MSVLRITSDIRETAATVNLLLTNLVVTAGEGEHKHTEKVEGSEGVEEGSQGVEEGSQGEEEGSQGGLELAGVVGVLTQMLHHSSVHTKVAALDWILHLYNKLPAQPINVPTAGAQAFPMDGIGRLGHDPPRGPSADWRVLLTADATGTNGLTCLPKHGGARDTAGAAPASIECSKQRNEKYIYVPFGVETMRPRGPSARSLFKEMSKKLTLVTGDQMAAILVNGSALPSNVATLQLFRRLYGCWCHSPVALLALCLLTHKYRHCSRLITTFGDLEITVDFLTEVDKLVQLIESPIFAWRLSAQRIPRRVWI
ncbi:hypothetical protein evm_002434 [Chilo suppressalis]|nr:hypothetical protein evm_002434 [Chilo suppressalis]